MEGKKFVLLTKNLVHAGFRKKLLENGTSGKDDAVTSFVETVWRRVDILFKMCVIPDSSTNLQQQRCEPLTSTTGLLITKHLSRGKYDHHPT